MKSQDETIILFVAGGPITQAGMYSYRHDASKLWASCFDDSFEEINVTMNVDAFRYDVVLWCVNVM